MSAEAWSALIAGVGLIVAIAFQIREWRRASFSRGIEMIAALDARFETAEFREVRRRAAKYLQVPANPDEAGAEAARTVVNFFESVGFLYARRIVDAESVWHFFGSWVLPYYVATQEMRSKYAAGDPNIYSELEKIYGVVKQVEESRHPSGAVIHITNPEAIAEFLRAEAGLQMKALPSSVPSKPG